MDARIAMEAAKFGLAYSLSLAESIVYATARVEDALLWTRGKHIENLSGVKIVP
jgi:hypothetical protein